MPKKKKTNKKSTKVVPKNPRYLRRRRISPLKFVFWLVLALLAGFVAFNMYRFFFDKSYDLPSSPSEIIDSKKPEKKSSSSKNSSEKDSSSDSEESDSKDDGKNIPKNEGEDPNLSAFLTGSLTSANKTENALVLRVNIDQYLSSGTCSLKLENNDKVIEKTADIFPTASTSSCEGFDVSLSELDSGTWNILISLSSDGKTGEIKGEVEL